MRDDQGRPLNDRDLLARVAEIGALVVVRDRVQSTDFVTWRRELRRRAGGQGIRISVLQGDGFVVVHNPDHVVTEEQRHAAFAKIAEGLEPTGLPPVRAASVGPGLRSVWSIHLGPSAGSRPRQFENLSRGPLPRPLYARCAAPPSRLMKEPR